MQCKKCQTELEEGSNVCPNCGEEITGFEGKLKFWRTSLIVVACLGCLLLLALLAGVVNYGATGSFLPRPNDIFNKLSYSFSAEKLETEGGKKSFLGKMDKVVATMGEHQLDNRLLQVYYWRLVKSNPYTDMDSSKPLDSQIQDPETGMTWQQYMLQEALKMWKQDMILTDMATAAGFQMPENYVAQFASLEQDLTAQATSNGYASLEAMLEGVYGPGANFQSYYQYLWNYYYGALYYNQLVENTEVTMPELEAYYTANEQSLATAYEFPVSKDSGKLVDVRHILIKVVGTGKDEDGKTVITDEDWETCRQGAQEVLDQYLSGNLTAEAFGELAVKKSQDGGSASKGGLYENVYPGQMVEEFNDWCFDDSRKEGDTGLVKTQYGYHVMYYVGGEEGWIRICTDGVKLEKGQKLLDEKVEAAVLEVNYRAIVLAELTTTYVK